jgi:polyphosphate kinase 2 (PPK2 family)
LVERVHKIVPDKVWKRRYGDINEFEKILAADTTTIVKFYLHIDKDEQKKRLEERLKDPTEHWKFSPHDLPERKFWSEYMEAYQDAMEKTSTDWAHWYLIPANHKWFRDIIVSTIIVKMLEKLDMHYPPLQDPKSIVIK